MASTKFLGASSAAALACMSMAAFAATGSNNGGGSTLAQNDYNAEFSTFNGAATSKEAIFGTYWAAGSSIGQQSFLLDDLTCDENAVTGDNGGACSNRPGGANAVHYAASDNTFSSQPIALWATSSYGQTLAGNLIQLPSMGVGTAIAVNDTNITANGQVTLSNNDLCGIFSGSITDFSQITDSATAPAAGPFKVVYSSDGSITTFLLTNHLSAVCASKNTHAGVTFTATTNFASLFGGTPTNFIPNAIGEADSIGVASYMAGLSGGAVPQAIGYLSPDFTTVDPSSGARLSNGASSPLVTASIMNGKVAEQPTACAGLQGR